MLDFPVVGGVRLTGSEASYRLSISAGGPSWKETLRLSGEGDEDLNRLGLASGRGGRAGGAITAD